MQPADSLPPPQSRQFTLRTLFAIVTILAALLSVYSYVGVGVLAIAYLAGAVCMVVFGAYHSSRRGWAGLGACLLVIGFFAGPEIFMKPDPGRRGECQNNMKQVVLAVLISHEQKGRLPARNYYVAGVPSLSWRASILPYLEQSSLAAALHYDEPWNSVHNLMFGMPCPAVLCCPSSPRGGPSGETQYLAVAGDDTCWPDHGIVKLNSLPDGASHTALLVESHDLNVIWSEPRDLEFATLRASPQYFGLTAPQDEGPSSPHRKENSPMYFSDLVGTAPSGAHMGMADGSIRFMSEKTDPEVVKQLLNRHDGAP